MAEQIISKHCSKCKEIKPVSEFYKRKDNHKYRNECKICFLKQCKEYSKTEKGKEVSRKAQHHHNQTEKGKATKKRYAQSEKGKANYNHRAKYYQKLHPERPKALHTVNHAIRDSKLPRPDSLSCYYCPAQAKQYHHYKGYAPEHQLDVVPVCGRCHYFLSHL